MIYTIVPVYNCINYLESAVKSVLSQPNKNIKIILVDDGSTDGSGKLCDKLSSDSCIKVIHTQNGGVSIARNIGIEYVLKNSSDGDYFAFLDADDMWVKNVITEELINKYADYEIIGFGTYLSNPSGNRYKFDTTYNNEKIKLPERSDAGWLFKGHFGAHLYSCNLIKNFNIRFMENVRLNEDIIFIRQCFYATNSVALLDKILYVYRQNSNSVMHKNSINKENALNIAYAWNKIRSWTDDTTVFDKEQCDNWHKKCDAAVGMRLLEAARRLAENRYSKEEVSDIIYNSELYVYLENLNVNELASWQVEDLRLFREDFSTFINICKNDGRKIDFARKIKRIKPIGLLLERKMFNIENNDV